ncbi:MAG: hypothetical protein JXR10_18205 [Cyclobacteriaceae bacterium]
MPMLNNPVDSSLDTIEIKGELFYRISNVDKMSPFFMSVVSSSNHWMFISSNGGLTAGRQNAESSLFPYYTDDKLTELADITGSKSIFQVETPEGIRIWEPFSERQFGQYNYSRNLYKNFHGNKLMFEEVNHDLGLTFSYQWNSSDQFGFVKKSSMINHGDQQVTVTFLDGIQNILPAGVSPDLQGIRSNLVDAYKKCELEANVGLGIFALSAMIVDRAEPSEALKVNAVWSLGLNQPKYLICSDQLAAFRSGAALIQEEDIKARKGAYFVSETSALASGVSKDWMIIADVNHTATSIAALSHDIMNKANLADLVNQDIEAGSEELMHLVAASDGVQSTADKKRVGRHYSNTLFNIMRGGIFDNNYVIEKWDFETYLKAANKDLFNTFTSLLSELPAQFTHQDLKELTDRSENSDFKRLALEYMPLKFSRRHGDPSRPWNKFSINTKSEIDGSKILDYEGNWRDIFQNWEALAKSYPEFLDSMVVKFLNASTFDGYNPYRVTKDGFDWESIEEDDPWSYIGYWGDHQIIYLLKLLESSQEHHPGRLAQLFSEELFVYANVPYRIKDYKDLLANPKDTILFNGKLDHQIRQKREDLGGDGALLTDASGSIYKVNFIEKVLATTLAKMSNFIPEGGIWLNTQRPEWNDANNALVGNGVSMVTLNYLRRFFAFFSEILNNQGTVDEYLVSDELIKFFRGVNETLSGNSELLTGSISDAQRKNILDGVGEAGSDYRNNIYDHSFSGKKGKITKGELIEFTQICNSFLEHSIRANKREDEMYHAYNLMTVVNNQEISIGYLDEMLEGQVAALSSGYLDSQESLRLLDALKSSKLFREDQYSYVLYPNKELPRFVDKNVIPSKQVESSTLLSKLVEKGEVSILEKDVAGNYHFNGTFNNADNLKRALQSLSENGYSTEVNKESESILQIFEDVFNHKAFTGRSGTFFGYEGLGSIYWHMVSKLLLAVEECCMRAVENGESAETVGRLMEHYYEINEGIGVHKPPSLYGAFSTDPYSHTPANKGVQQPGMTGQVKEDILSRIGELGAMVKEGCLVFRPSLLRANEFHQAKETFHFIDLNGIKQSIELEADSLAFTYCQVPVIYTIGSTGQIVLTKADGSTETFDSLGLSNTTSESIFNRKGEIKAIQVIIPREDLR